MCACGCASVGGCVGAGTRPSTTGPGGHWHPALLSWRLLRWRLTRVHMSRAEVTKCDCPVRYELKKLTVHERWGERTMQELSGSSPGGWVARLAGIATTCRAM